MIKDDLLVLPIEWGRIEMAWPFSLTSKHFDQELRRNGCQLTRKVFAPYLDEHVSIFREYKIDDGVYTYAHQLRLPMKLQRERYYRDFEPEDVTWCLGQPRIPDSILFDRFADYRSGHERFEVQSGNKFYVKVEVNNKGCDVRIKGGFREQNSVLRAIKRYQPTERKKQFDRGPPPFEIDVKRSNVFTIGTLKDLLTSITAHK